MIRDNSQVDRGRSSGETSDPFTYGTIWQEIADARTTEEFCRSWLALQCHTISDVSGGVLVLGTPESGRFAPAATWPPGAGISKQLAAAAERGLLAASGLVLKQDGKNGGGGASHCQVAHPISVAGNRRGVVALAVGERDDDGLQVAARQLQVGSAWLEGLLARDGDGRSAVGERGPSDAQARVLSGRLKTLMDLTATILQHERFQAAATAFVTELATRLDCERVTVGFLRRRRVQLRAMSHSAQFGKKTNLVRAIEKAMDEALDQESTVLYPQPSDVDGAGFRITRAHKELSRQHGSGAICSVPLTVDNEVLGVLTLEREEEKRFDPQAVELCETVSNLAGPLLELRRRDDRWLASKAAESSRRLLGGLLGRGYLGWKVAGILFVAAVVFFAFFKADFRVSASTVLEGSIQRAAVAPFRGYIAEAPARAGDIVKQGSVLCVLEDKELRLEHQKWRSQLEQVRKQYHQAMAQHDAAQVKISQAQIEKAKAQLALVADQLSRTKVLAPVDGLVVTGDLSQSIGAPVERGDVLFELAPLESYRVILEVDERDVSYVRVAQKGHLMLSALPTNSLPFVVEKITPVSTAREGRNYFRVEACLEDTPERLRPGMEGIGKVTIERRHLIWIWTRPAIDWLRLTLWSWLP